MTLYQTRSQLIRLVSSALLGAILLASCKVGPDYKQPAMTMPANFRETATRPSIQAGTAPSTQPDLKAWWKLFGDEDLTGLVEAANANNPDLKAAVARVEQARAAAGVTKADFYPTISFDPSISRQRTVSSSGKASTRTMTSIPFDLSYEIDVWGRVRRSMDSANAQVLSSQSALGVVMLTLQADVAQNYFNLRALDIQDGIVTEMVTLLEHELSLFERQRAAGIVNNLDVSQAKAQLQSEVAQQEDLRRQRALVEHALAILTGKSPSELQIHKRDYSFTPPAIPAGLPSELLRRRPDILEAEQNLIAANAQVGVAKANFYPVFKLTGAAGFESYDLKSALDWQNRVWSLGPSVSVPLFEGGRLSASLAQTKARYDELTHTFRSTVLTAVREVEDELSDLRHRAQAGEALNQAVVASREYLRLSEVQYKAGTANFLVVIDANRTLLTNQLSAVQVQSQRNIATVLLIKALGGGWDPAAQTEQ